MKNKIIVGLIFAFFSITSQSQNKDTFILLKSKQESHCFISSELRIDSIFMKNLNNILFDNNDCWWKSDTLNSLNKVEGHFFISFKKIDAFNYYMEVSLWNNPVEKSIGFLKYKKYFYWLSGKVPNNLILKTKIKKRFFYVEYYPIIEDPLIWVLIYNTQTGNIQVEKKNFY